VEIKSPRIPVISNVDAKPHYDPDDIRETLAKQVTNFTVVIFSSSILILPILTLFETILILLMHLQNGEIQVTSPVQWETIITTMVKSPDFEKSYELGPGTVCRGNVENFYYLNPINYAIS